jgi:hypothetical protein
VEQVDRRQFLQKAGVAGAAAGAVWVAPSVLGSSSAFAAGSCINPAGLVWSTKAVGSGATNTAATVTLAYDIAASGTSPAIHVVVTIAPVGSPGDGNPDGVDASSPFNGFTSYYKASMTNNAAQEGYNITFNFYQGTVAGGSTTPVNVYKLAFSIFDIDRNNVAAGFNDQVSLTPGFTILSQGAEVHGNGTAPPPAGTPWIGSGTGGITDSSGTVAVQWPQNTNPVNTVQIQYRSFEILNGVQSIGISNLTWCY